MSKRRTPVMRHKKAINTLGLGKPVSINRTTFNGTTHLSLTYIISYSDLMSKYRITNWERNRSPDMVRIPEIESALSETNDVDGKIYLVYRAPGEMSCYDGMHRMTALYRMYSDNILSNNATSSVNTMETESDIYTDLNHTLTIVVLPKYNEDFVTYKFEMLNRCVPLPIIDNDLTHIVNNVTDYTYTKYNTCFVGSSRPNKPHENRDRFKTKLQNIIVSLNMGNSLEEDIYKLLTMFNNFVKHNYNSFSDKSFKLTNNQFKKCKDADCFLFAMNNWDTQLIERYNGTGFTS